MSESPSLAARIGGRLLRSRRLMRAPIWIYRARAGAIFGSRILMLEHTGRKSGLPRYAVLEVVDHPARVASESWCKSTGWFAASSSAYGLRNLGDRPARSCR